MGKVARRCWKLLAALAAPAVLGLVAASLEMAAALLMLELVLWLLYRFVRWLKPGRRLVNGIQSVRRMERPARNLLFVGFSLGWALVMAILDADGDEIAAFLMFMAVLWVFAWVCRKLKIGARIANGLHCLFGRLGRVKQSVKSTVLVVLTMGTALCLTCQLWTALTWVVLLDVAAALVTLGIWAHRKIAEIHENEFHFRDFSLQVTYVFYVVTMLVAATVLCVLTVAGIDQWRSNLDSRQNRAGMVLNVPDGGRVEVQMVDDFGDVGRLIIRDGNGGVVRECNVDLRTSTIGYFYDGEVVDEEDWYPSYNKVIVRPAESRVNRALDVMLAMLQLLSIPAIYVGASVFCAMAFYRRKLKTPISILNDAAGRIAANSLDFHVEYVPRDEMGSLCDSFELMRGALQRNNAEMWRQMEERRRLNAAFSHDLRTPLTVLKGHAEMLRTGIPDGSISSTEVLQEVEAMTGSITRLENYVAAMSRLQRLEDVEIHIEPVSAADFARELGEAGSILCGERLTLEAPEGVVWLMDPEVVMQVVENLLGNAMRYARSRIMVSICEEEGKLSITVSDDGPGFSSADLDKATEPFYRGDKGGEGHLGLGLNICRILCERHGGGVRVGNAPQGGARVQAWVALGHR